MENAPAAAPDHEDPARVAQALALCEQLLEIDPDALTPREALAQLYALRAQLARD
jgi:hypothetical protein